MLSCSTGGPHVTASVSYNICTMQKPCDRLTELKHLYKTQMSNSGPQALLGLDLNCEPGVC